MGGLGKAGFRLGSNVCLVLIFLLTQLRAFASDEECRQAIFDPDTASLQQTLVATAEALAQKASEACQKPAGCPSPFDAAIQTGAKSKWDQIKLIPQRAAFVSVWAALTFGSSLGAYHLGSLMGKDIAIALTMSTSVLSTAIFMPLGNAFLFRLTGYFQKKGHEYWAGKDTWSRDRRSYDEIKAYGRRQSIDVRQARLVNLLMAVKNIKENKPELAADKIAEAMRVSYRLFKGVHSDDTTVADAIDTFFKREVELPPAFYTALDQQVAEMKWSDIPTGEKDCRKFFNHLMTDWFPERNPKLTNRQIAVNDRLNRHGGQ